MGISTLMLVAALLLGGCVSEPLLPASVLTGAETPPFLSLQHDPGSYAGHRIVLGGEVLRATRRADRTDIEVLQLPLDAQEVPMANRTASQGRFLVYQKDFDPATLPQGTLITVVGEGKGSVLQPLDDMEYAYPIIESDYLKAWPSWPSLGYAYDLYDDYGSWWYPYYYYPYRSPYFYSGLFLRPFPLRPSHSHFHPAPQNTPRPPQFRRRR
jgi:outer membrane lipoprotein